MNQQVKTYFAWEGMLAMIFLIRPRGRQWVEY
jgi:hypothetical protein